MKKKCGWWLSVLSATVLLAMGMVAPGGPARGPAVVYADDATPTPTSTPTPTPPGYCGSLGCGGG